MSKMRVLFLSQDDIVGLKITMEETIAIVEAAFREHGRGAVENPPKPGVHPVDASFIHAMPAWIPGMNACGVKWVSGYPGNRAKGLPMTLGVFILNDAATGVPLAIMDCGWITAVRTAAVTAVTAKYCAKRECKVLGVIGAGVQGRSNLIALKVVRPEIEKVVVYDINPAATKRYQEEMSARAGVEVVVADDPREAVVDADIIVTATQRLKKPIVKRDWVKAGSLACPLEVSRAWEDDALLAMDKFITDDFGQLEYFATQGAFPGGIPPLYAELGQVVVGNKPGRETEQERILAVNVGIGATDVALGQRIYSLARERGVGVELVLADTQLVL